MINSELMNRFDVFIIDSNNWQNQKDLFFGYKTINENTGFFLNIKNNIDNLKITGSFLKPLTCYFKKDNYWALSNSYYFLEQYVKEQGYKLTENTKIKDFFDWVDKTDNKNSYSTGKQPEFGTITNEIDIIPEFDELTIDSNGFRYIETDFSKEIYNIDLKSKEAEKIIDEWWNDWSNYLKECANNKTSKLNVYFSGGYDSRVLFGMWYKLPVSKIEMKFQKSRGIPKNDLYDGLIARCIYYKYKLHQIPTEEQLETIESKELCEEGKKVFLYGTSHKSESNGFKNINEITNRKNNIYLLQGNGGEVVKHGSLFNKLYDLETDDPAYVLKSVIRRRDTEIALTKYYLNGEYSIAPFFDKRIMQFKFDTDLLLYAIIYLKYEPDLISHDLPFVSLGHYTEYLPEKTVKEAQEILDEWKKQS